ncbi:hypothetical protein RUM43_011829 [Polyplax serrata]|uniref:Uncharacterized protein n=1 Tax=Polyplax serrata TaxID=468196 RepID=A0AAN8PJU6_POLSC
MDPLAVSTIFGLHSRRHFVSTTGPSSGGRFCPASESTYFIPPVCLHFPLLRGTPPPPPFLAATPLRLGFINKINV